MSRLRTPGAGATRGRRPDAPSRLAAAAASGAAATVVSRALGGRLATSQRWTRTNHRGEPISLLAGPAAIAGLTTAALTLPDPRQRAAAMLVDAGAGAVGLLDDLGEDTSVRRKGLRGHLGALARGEVTTGAIKVIGIVAAGVGAAALVTPAGGRSRTARVCDVVVSAGVIAGAANLVNLLDLRPGRARKVLLAANLPMAAGGSALASATMAVTAAGMADDLAERDMLGDAGANALGAATGLGLVLAAPRAARVAALATITALTVASERVSFSAVIAQTPVLARIDAWGRRQA